MVDRIKAKIAELNSDIQYHKEEIAKAEKKKEMWAELLEEEMEDLAEEAEESEEIEEGEPGCESNCDKVEVREISYGA